MIIWINGAFGAGKSQTAYELKYRIGNSHVYDPENIGGFIRKNVPESLSGGDYQDYPMWRGFNRETLSYIADHYRGTIIVPMTVVNRSYYDELIGALSEKYDVRHIILCESEKTIRRRLASRFEGADSWASEQIGRCLTAFHSDIPGEKLRADRLSISETAEAVAKICGIRLMRDDRNALQKKLYRLKTQISLIR